MENTNALTIKTFNDVNVYNIVLTDFNPQPAYTQEISKWTEEEEIIPNNQIIFATTPTTAEIKACLETNIKYLEHLVLHAWDDYYPAYIPYYIEELLYFTGGLYNHKLITREELLPFYIKLFKIAREEFGMEIEVSYF